CGLDVPPLLPALRNDGAAAVRAAVGVHVVQHSIGATAMRRHPLHTLPIVLVAAATVACIDSLVGPDPGSTPPAILEQVWRAFDRNYALFTVRGVDWAAARDRYKGQADLATSIEKVALVIG